LMKGRVRVADVVKPKDRAIAAKQGCFLIKDKSLLQGWDSTVYHYLWSKGFVRWQKKGISRGVDWVFANICDKIFAPGIPGYPVTAVACDHAVTFEEFKTIYEIFNKYIGLDPLVMTKEEQEERNRKRAEIEELERKYVSELTYEKFFNEVKEELAPNLKPWCKTEEEVINYMKKNEKVIKEAYERNKRMFTDKQKEWEHVRYASSVAECLEWMYE